MRTAWLSTPPITDLRYVLTCVVALLAACGDKPPPTQAQLDQWRPAEAALAARYERSCLLCHGRVGSGAPLSGDTSAWAPRLARGPEALLASARQGLGAMPAMGLCADCSDADLHALITFMSQDPR